MNETSNQSADPNKREEQTLQEIEQRLSMTQKIAHIGNWEWNLQTNGLYWSEENYRIFGLSSDISPSVQVFLDTVHPDDLDIVKKSIDNALNGNPYDIDMRIIRPDGEERIVDAKAEVNFDKKGNPFRMFGTVQDITERIQAQEKLQLFRNLIDESNDSITVNNPENGRILDANKKACRSLGYTREELLNMCVTDFEVTLPDNFSWNEHVKEVEKKGNLVLEGRHRRKDGTTFPVEVNVTFLESGKRSHMIAIVRDISDRKKAETLYLENARLEAADRAKSEFLANMSHELRTPLNAILGFSELLQMNSAGKLSDKQYNYVKNVVQGGKHLLNLINDILDLSKVEAGKIDIMIEKISVPEIIHETLSLIKENASKNNVIIKERFDPQLAFIEADKQRFKQILFNLISNAVKFSKQDGGTVTIETHKEGDMAKISVSDTGIGIKESDMEKLFKEFTQLDSGTTRKYGGTGLGLAITKQLIELHRGKIWAQSRYGKGSTFTFSLPLRPCG